MRRRLTPLGIAFALAALVMICASALAYFSAGGTGVASAAVAKLTAGKLTATPAAGGKVTLTWTAATVPGGSGVTYYVERDGEAAGGNCPTEAAPTAVLTCADTPVAIGSHEYVVTAVFHTWSAVYAPQTATVMVGVATKFAITATTATPVAGAGINLTITAQDENGSTVGTFTGAHTLVFSGASSSTNPVTAPSVSNSSGSVVAFGSGTALNFVSGSATVQSTTKNGVLKIYRVGQANVTATEGTLTDPTPLPLDVQPGTASKYTIAPGASTVPTDGEDPLTITALDAWGNLATGYTGSHNLVFSPTWTSPSGALSSVTGSDGSDVPFGTATPIAFSEGVATAAEGANGVLTATKAGTLALKAAEGTTVTTPTAASIVVTPGAAASLKMTASSTVPAAGASVTLTFTALDAYGNTATGYTGSKNLVFAGAAASPSGQLPTVTNQSGTAVNFGTATPQTFAGGTKTATLKLYRAGAAAVTVSDGTFTSAPVNFTVSATTAAKIAWVNMTQSAGTGASSCFLTCTITGVGNGGTVSGNLEIVDAYGNLTSNYGAAKTGTVTANGGTVTGGSMVFPETGPAVTTTAFTFTYPATGTTTLTLTANATSRTAITGSVAK